MKTAALFALLLSTTGSAQVVMQPTPPPSVTAAGTSWYRNQEPIFYAGSFYYPSGPLVHFNPNELAATGQYNGVPLYENKTIEPFSMVFVPIGGGLMRPYERRRDGELAGTSGSVAASRFPTVIPPVGVTASSTGRPGEVGAPPAGFTTPPATLEAVGTRGAGEPRPVGTTAVVGTTFTASELGALAPPRFVATAIPPRSNRGISIMYAGHRWIGARETVHQDPARFEQAGEYHGFPVYAERGARDRGRTIYLPVAGGMLAMYRCER